MFEIACSSYRCGGSFGSFAAIWGWFIYRQVTMQSPLEKLVSQYPGVTSAQIDIKQDQVVLKLDLKPQADVAGLVDVVKQKDNPSLAAAPLSSILQTVPIQH